MQLRIENIFIHGSITSYSPICSQIIWSPYSQYQKNIKSKVQPPRSIVKIPWCYARGRKSNLYRIHVERLLCMVSWGSSMQDEAPY
jgi:hypothetical protein